MRPTSPAQPGGQIPIFNRATAYLAYDPKYSHPLYRKYDTFSVTRSVTRSITVDARYEGTLGRKRIDSAFGLGGVFGGGLNLNLPNVYTNKELFEALEMTRQGHDAPLFDQMLAGLSLTTLPGYGPVGTTVNGVLQHGSAHLRRNTTFANNLAIGNYDAIASSLNTLSTVSVASGPGALQSLPAGLTGVNGRVLRNGCDRLASGLYNPTLPASNTNIPTRCFPENYIVANPQLSTASYLANLGKSNYHSMQLQFTLRPVMGISFQTTYTWAKTLGLVPGGYTNPLDRNADYAPPYQAVNHDLRTNGTFELPFGPNRLMFTNASGWVARLIEKWQASVIMNASSGNPRTVIGAHMLYATGSQNLDIAQSRADIASPLFDQAMKGHVVWDGPNNDTGTYYGKNFAFVPDPQCGLTDHVDSMGFNLFTGNGCALNAVALKNSDGTTGPIVLQNPLPGHRGNMPFSLEAPGKWRFDANIAKTFRLSESKSLQFRMDAQNVMNHADPSDPQPQTGQSINSAGITWGQIPNKGGSGANLTPRSFQAQLRFTF